MLRTYFYKKMRLTFRVQTCWAISNLCAGTRDQIQAIIDSNIIPSLFVVLERVCEIHLFRIYGNYALFHSG